MKTVYLAGAMEFAADGGTSWRVELTHWLAETLGHSALDPTHLEHDQLSEEERLLLPSLRQRDFDTLRSIARKIIRYDVDLVLNRCDYLVVHWNESTQRGCGTAGEITLAAWAGKPVHLVLDYPREKASTWMVGCTSSIHSDWEDLKKHLLATYGSSHPCH